MDWIWDDIDIQSEDFSIMKPEDYDAVPAYANAARLLKLLIYYGCRSRGGLIVRVHPDLTISFPGPIMMY